MKLKQISFVAGILSLWAAFMFARWGRPFPWHVVLTEQIDSNHDGTIDSWQLRDTKNGETILERDTNQDGRVDQIQFGNPKGKLLDLSDIAIRETPKKKLIVCLDGV